MKKPSKQKPQKPKAVKQPVLQTQRRYELLNHPEYGYVFMPDGTFNQLTDVTMLLQGKILRQDNLFFINHQPFARLHGRVPKVNIPLRDDVSKDKLAKSLRAVLAEEGLL